ncbi:MAG: fumarylacetoacetase [Gemmatimonadales bacterium]
MSASDRSRALAVRRVDHTHDERLTSWVASANEPGCDFPIQNLPFGIFRAGGRGPRVGVAIGSQVLDLAALAESGSLEGLDEPVVQACGAPLLNDLMALGAGAWVRLRHRLVELLVSGAPAAARVEGCLVRAADAALELPARVGDYTDFYASIHHATNVGRLFRPDSPLLPNYKWVPVGYHGRASSVVPSGHRVSRPLGQRRAADREAPTFGPSEMLDYEAELGAWVGPGNDLGSRVPVEEAEAHVFGLSLLNDWSARDVQAWEYQPLGPFLGKSFATTVSPWIVTLEALAPFRARPSPREPGDPEPLPYLLDGAPDGGVDVVVEAWLETEWMRARGTGPARLGRASARELYWTFAQMLAHHTSNGCNLRPGDLIGSGTLSGAASDSLGCLLEITRRGRDPLALPTGETRTFLADGDEVILRASCERPGFRRIGFGECRGVVAPSPEA